MKFDVNLILEKFNQLDLRIRYAIFGAILGLFFIFDFLTIIRLQQGAVEKLDEKNKTLASQIERLRGDLQRVDQIKAGLQKSRAQLEAMNAKIRPVEEIPLVVQEISRLASEGGIKIEQLDPQIQAQTSLVSTPTTKYYLLPIVIQAVSGYHIFGRFLNQLEQERLLFTLGNLTVTRRDDTRNQVFNVTLNFIVADKVANPAGGKK